MDKRISISIFIGLIVLYSLLTAANVFLPQGTAVSGLPVKAMPAPLPVMAAVAGGIVLVAYGVLGFVGLVLSRKIGIPEIWDSAVTNRQRFFIPALVGAGLGVLVILGDAIFSRFNGMGPFPHPPFPTSVIAAVAAAIGEETIFRLFFISFWTWLVSRVLLRGRFLTAVYWVVSVISAVAFGMSHLPAVLVLQGWTSISQVPPVLIAELLLLNGIIALAAAYLFRKYGFLAPVGVHLWCDVVWHVIWGLV